MLVSSLSDGSVVNSLDCPSLRDVSLEDIHVKVGHDNWCRGTDMTSMGLLSNGTLLGCFLKKIIIANIY